MNFNELSYFVYQKYGLKFKPAIPGSTNLYYLSAPQSEDYFAILSRIKKLDRKLLTLDLKTGDFTELIRDLPTFTDSFKIKSNEWVGIWLDQVSLKNIESAFDYAFKLAVNKSKSLPSQPYLVLPGENEEKYQAQVIPKRKRIKQESIPAQIQKMRESYDYSILPAKGRAKNFYHQGIIMADYNENFEDFAAFKRYYPTYHDMSVKQLQTYFAWRAKIRTGEFYRTSVSYCYVYIYELLNQIGVKSTIDGLKKLTLFLENYAQKFDLKMSEYLSIWIKDYIIYYHLEDAVEETFKNDLARDFQYQVLLNPEENSVSDLYQILRQFSPYLDKLNSKIHGKKFQEIVYFAWKNVLQINGKKSFFSKYVAKKAIKEKYLFAGAIFYPRKNLNKDLIIDPVRRYFYQNERWYLETLSPVNRQKVELNNFFHEVDRLYRLHFQIGKLKPRKLEFEYLQAIQTGIAEFEDKAKKTRQKQVEINFSSLNKIRLDASQTRDSLLTDEEKKLEQEEQVQAAKKIISSENISTENEYDLSKDEMTFLIDLLNKRSYQEFLQQKHLMASILADAINEKLFDEIGDSVIEFNQQDQPEIVEDYQADLEKIFLRR